MISSYITLRASEIFAAFSLPQNALSGVAANSRDLATTERIGSFFTTSEFAQDLRDIAIPVSAVTASWTLRLVISLMSCHASSAFCDFEGIIMPEPAR